MTTWSPSFHFEGLPHHAACCTTNSNKAATEEKGGCSMPGSLLSAVATLSLAVATVVLGSHFAVYSPDNLPDEQQVMSYGQIIAFPIISSIVLVMLFYYFWLFQYMLLAVLGLGAFSAVCDILRYALLHVLSKSKEREPTVDAVAIVLTLLVLYLWAVHGNFVAHDVIGCSLCASFISILRFPNLKTATLCMLLLFCYDFFWVFLSEGIFKKNVMVEVASKQASSPIQLLGEKFGVSLLKAANAKIELPLKLLIPSGEPGRYSILGLGDMAMPGILCSLALRCDRSRTSSSSSSSSLSSASSAAEAEEQGMPFKGGEGSGARGSSVPPRLFHTAVAGYAVGLSLAFGASFSSGRPQPALVYIVPVLLLFLVARARVEGVLPLLWTGPIDGKDKK